MDKPTTDKELLSSNSLDIPPNLIHRIEQTNDISEITPTSEIIKVNTTSQNSKQKDHLILDIPERTFDTSTKDDIRTNTPITPQQTPKRVDFSPLCSPTYTYTSFNESSSRGKSSFKSLIPKLSFKFIHRTSEIEKAAILALDGLPSDMREKGKMSRNLSFTKLFTPRMKRTSSLPVSPIAHSNPESMHGKNTTEKSWIQRPTYRSHSVPDLIKDVNVTQIESLGGVFRIIPTTPKVSQANHSTLNVNPMVDTLDGNDHEDEGEDIAEE